MAGDYRFGKDQKDITKFLITTVDSFIQDRLINKEQRALHKEQCAERLAAEDGSYDKDTEVRYSDQAVLANLDWGIEALEEAINTANLETKMARLDYAEKMLQVCAMLNSDQRTAGVPNFYLSAWAHLNLSYLWKLRNNVRDSVLHVLEMFVVDPFFSRIDFAPELWRDLFLPHMSSIVGWYSEERHRLVMEVIPDYSDFSLTCDMDEFFNESLVLSMRPEQVGKMQKLEQLYGESLDGNTRLFAKYYVDSMNSDSNTSKKMIPMFPIAEPPMTPRHEVSRSIPDYVKFGPILPKNAGFSPAIRSKNGAREARRLSISPSTSYNLEEPAVWEPQNIINEENKDHSDSKPRSEVLDSEDKIHYQEPLRSMKVTENKNFGTTIKSFKANTQSHSPTIFSPMHSPRSFSPKLSSKDVNFGKESTYHTPSLPLSPATTNDYSLSSADSDREETKSVRNNYVGTRTANYNNVNSQELENSSVNGSDEGSQSCISLPMSHKLSSSSRPPKDFVCPITSQLFNDPVTLETGQTYERKAIQEWLKRGNTTCPITRQPLSADSLPKTNYVLKRLITSWKEQYPDLAQEFSYSETPRSTFSSSSVKGTSLATTPLKMFDVSIHNSTGNHIHQRNKRFVQTAVSTSPTSVISQATIEAIINGLKPYISCICTSENLQDCEAAVLAIAKLWKDSKGDPGVHSCLSKLTTVNGFVEILSNSLDREVLRMSIYTLSELIFSDESVAEILTSVDSDFDCLAALLKNGLAEAAVLIYQLRPTFAQLSSHNLIPSLVYIIQNKNENYDLQLVIDPKDASIAILEQILTGGDESSQSISAFSVISANGVPVLVKCLDRVEARKSVISILLCCMIADKSCRYYIASRIKLSPVLELLHSGNDCVRGICIDFLSELVQLNRRTFCIQILKIIKDEGSFSTMHTFLVYLQMAPMEQQPAIAALLLQLDLLVEPQKMSIYREEAVETFIEALHKKDFSNFQMMGLDALLSLSGRLTSSGKSYMEPWLLKIAGFNQPYSDLMKAEGLKMGENDFAETMEDEEKAASSWEKKVAFVLCNHDKGSIFKALEECFKSNSLEMAKLCLVISTWLVYMLSVLPDTGVKEAARKSLLDEFINVLQSSRNTEEKILAALALRTFVIDSAALDDLEKYAKCIYKTLRKFKRTSSVITDILKSLMNLSSVNATELWNCREVIELESSANGEVLSLVHLKGRLLSSHSDGTIKVWDSGKRGTKLIQEIHEHVKAVTCLYVPSSGDKLYSGSLDKTIRVWAIKPEEIRCVQIHDVKMAVHELTANAKVACFTSQGTGVKVYSWSGVPIHVTLNKNVKCLAMSGDKLYCGCSGYTIQEVDLCKLTSTTFYSGARKLLGKQVIHSLHINDGLLFAGGSAVDGAAGKVFCQSTRGVLGSFSTGLDILHIVTNSDFIFTATKCGTIEVWLKEKFINVASIKTSKGGNAKITSLTSDMNDGMLYAGFSDGRIQVWAMD
ncbi:putative E3 ubiquitin-protein ligase LIN-1 [Mercurialis annua]|uniref:putative E3 ubiquitin-protein ligase LIN-1 n=1 Tax=Mercurialis annua TaxID=3986 RepID=UPI002160CEFD|nr:putative E3 ubiquitin-protein ligase LIN-1 [Mercurialis annua]XP_050226980.1 putative E3 ubiquitin-protein ligase LIN-1 [Mercurialis annua]